MSPVITVAMILRAITPALLLLASCHGAGLPDGGGSGNGAPVSADSTYLARLAKWRRDSLVLDSLTALARTDSLYHLYRRALAAPGTSPALLEEVNCEYARLRRRVGIVPAQRAFGRMRDTVYADEGIHDSKGADRRFFSRTPDSAFVTDMRSCGVLGPPFPWVLDGTATSVEPKKPTPPRQP